MADTRAADEVPARECEIRLHIQEAATNAELRRLGSALRGWLHEATLLRRWHVACDLERLNALVDGQSLHCHEASSSSSRDANGQLLARQGDLRFRVRLEAAAVASFAGELLAVASPYGKSVDVIPIGAEGAIETFAATNSTLTMSGVGS